MNIDDIKRVAVIGAGDMGHGIAEVALMAGYPVFLRDVTQEFVDRGVQRVDDSLKKLVKKGRVPQDVYDKIQKELLHPCVQLSEAVAEADLVIEAIPEVLDLKRQAFAEMDRSAPAHTILASNTSTMSITKIAQATKRPEKVVGLHYFNPAVIMKLVEVIRGEKTSDETMQVAYDFCLKNNKIPVRVEKDVPGFIVNRVQAPSAVLLGAILDEGIAQPEEIDALMRSLGMPMGPCELMDFTGLDINYHASRYFTDAVHPDFAPARTIEEKVNAGALGKKTGKGFFDWSQGRPQVDLSRATSKVDPLDLLAVQINEATKLIEMGVCSAEDVDTAIVNGTGNKIGYMAMAKGQDPEELAKRLDGLAERFNKEIFRPTKMIREGTYR
jgi:enoyl-CoA hydratase/3-hydroxyacyl-CoA dehydrogenase